MRGCATMSIWRVKVEMTGALGAVLAWAGCIPAPRRAIQAPLRP